VKHAVGQMHDECNFEGERQTHQDYHHFIRHRLTLPWPTTYAYYIYALNTELPPKLFTPVGRQGAGRAYWLYRAMREN
jgi:hypothetical protein